ncbi:serpin family protein [bacterium]|nr:serpin family protein [candidate division CSSED10-310 bacterium]
MMRKNRSIDVIILTVVCVVLCASYPGTGTAAASLNQPLSATASNRSKELTMFAWDIYHKLSMKDGNVFISPISISTALTLTWAGAGSTTSDEMSKMLHFSGDNNSIHSGVQELNLSLHSIPEITIANALFPDKRFPLRNDYLELVSEKYMASLTPLDYVEDTELSRVHINRWVETQTKEKIRNLITRGNLDASTVMVLVNALYFKGTWTAKFDPAATTDGQFYTAENQYQAVPMMHQKNSFKYYESDELQLLEMPYSGDRLAMIFLLPRKIDYLNSLEKALCDESLVVWLDQMSSQTVSLWIPKFKMEWGTTDISPELKALGMRSAFTAEADFSGMSRMKGINVSMILHKTYIEIDEEGTEAAGATAVVMRKTSMPRQIEFKLDHPFIFLIRDKLSGSILFIGRILSFP